jgi:hypothetical protein
MRAGGSPATRHDPTPTHPVRYSDTTRHRLRRPVHPVAKPDREVTPAPDRRPTAGGAACAQPRHCRVQPALLQCRPCGALADVAAFDRLGSRGTGRSGRRAPERKRVCDPRPGCVSAPRLERDQLRAVVGERDEVLSRRAKRGSRLRCSDACADNKAGVERPPSACTAAAYLRLKKAGQVAVRATSVLGARRVTAS